MLSAAAFALTKLLKLFPDYGDVYNIAWTGSNRWLLAGDDSAVCGMWSAASTPT